MSTNDTRKNKRKMNDAMLKQHFTGALACAVCGKRYTHPCTVLKHAHKKHTPEELKEHGFPVKRESPMTAPLEFDQVQFRFVKKMVKDCIKNDKKSVNGKTAEERFTEEDAAFLRENDNNEFKQKVTVQIMQSLKESFRIETGMACYDDAEGYLPNGFDFHSHSLFKFSLDKLNKRGKQKRPHFIDDGTGNYISNIQFIVHGMNNSCDIAAEQEFETCRILREKQVELDYSAEEIKTQRFEKSIFINTNKKKNQKKINGKLYSSCSNTFRLSSEAVKKTFNNDKNVYFGYCLRLLEEQNYRCAVTNIKLTNSAGYFQTSVDAIDPNNGHVRGNLRIVCQFVNNSNCDKQKQDGVEYEKPTAWTSDLFNIYIQSEKSKKIKLF